MISALLFRLFAGADTPPSVGRADAAASGALYFGRRRALVWHRIINTMSSSRDWRHIAALMALGGLLILAGLWWFSSRLADTSAASNGKAGKQSASQAKRLSSSGERRAPRPRPAGKPFDPSGDPSGLTETQMSLLDFLLKMKSGQPPKLTPEEVDAWLKTSGRSAANLVTAAQLLNDPELLKEAARKFPTDPRVQLEVLIKDALPQERQQWIAAFKLSSPDNALPNYLAARDLFKSGQPELAMQELWQAAQKPGMNTYAFDLQQSHQSAWTASGYPTAAAQLMSSLASQIPSIGPLNDVAGQVADTSAKYRQSGNVASADALAGAGLMMAKRYAGGTPTVIQDLVGMGMENRFLAQMNPESPVPGTSQTVAARQAELKERQQGMVTLMQSFDETAVTRLKDDDINAYFERIHTDGGYEAMKWLHSRLDAP
jgi:hypothetical protein